MSSKLTFKVPCPGGHDFDYEVLAEDLHVMRTLKGGNIHNVSCPTCAKTFKVPIADLMKIVAAEERAVRPAAIEEATVEEVVDGKTVRRVRGLEAKVLEKVLERTPAVAAESLTEASAAGTNPSGGNDRGRGQELDPPTPPDTEGTIDSTG